MAFRADCECFTKMVETLYSQHHFSVRYNNPRVDPLFQQHVCFTHCDLVFWFLSSGLFHKRRSAQYSSMLALPLTVMGHIYADS